MADRKEPYWDWFAARADCSADSVLWKMAELARKNVDAANAGQGSDAARFALVEDRDSRSFTVLRESRRPNDFVDFRAIGNEIAAGRRGWTETRASVVLNEVGDCCCKVGGDRYIAPWQFVRHVLEPFLVPQ